MSDFETNLRKYADLLVRVGNNVQPSSRLMIQAILTDDPTIRRLVHYAVESAYKAGAKFVKVEWRDDILKKIRLEHAPDESFDLTDEFYFHARKTITQEGGNIMFMYAGDPDLLSGQDQSKIARMEMATGKLFRPISILTDQGYGTWTIAAVAMQAWADKILPDIPGFDRVPTLWEYIFDVCRVNVDDPVTAWRDHAANLKARADYLNQKQYKELKYKSSGTFLSIGLPDNHIWIGGNETNNKNIAYMSNIPREEVYTMPHKYRINGMVKATKPISYGGTIIDKFGFTFKDGKIVGVTAEQGREALEALLDLDDGSRYLGEVALAPSNSPIAKTGRLFYNALFDENAANHLAIGASYRTAVQGGAEMNTADFLAVGGNESATHVDFMIGSSEMTVDGVTKDGTSEAIMRNGEWAFST